MVQCGIPETGKAKAGNRGRPRQQREVAHDIFRPEASRGGVHCGGTDEQVAFIERGNALERYRAYPASRNMVAWCFLNSGRTGSSK
jgi:hypothetical protein